MSSARRSILSRISLAPTKNLTRSIIVSIGCPLLIVSLFQLATIDRLYAREWKVIQATAPTRDEDDLGGLPVCITRSSLEAFMLAYRDAKPTSGIRGCIIVPDDVPIETIELYPEELYPGAGIGDLEIARVKAQSPRFIGYTVTGLLALHHGSATLDDRPREPAPANDQTSEPKDWDVSWPTEAELSKLTLMLRPGILDLSGMTFGEFLTRLRKCRIPYGTGRNEGRVERLSKYEYQVEVDVGSKAKLNFRIEPTPNGSAYEMVLDSVDVSRNRETYQLSGLGDKMSVIIEIGSCPE